MSRFFVTPGGCWNSPALVSYCMTTSWLAAAKQMKARESSIPSQDFTSDALPATTLPIYPGSGPIHSCWIAHSAANCCIEYIAEQL